jgi:hypothetical protein
MLACKTSTMWMMTRSAANLSNSWVPLDCDYSRLSAWVTRYGEMNPEETSCQVAVCHWDTSVAFSFQGKVS